MRHRTVLVTTIPLLIAAVSLTTVKSTLQTPPSTPPQEPFALRISFGHGESPQERWTGEVTVQEAEILESKGWLLRPEDRLSLNSFDFERCKKPRSWNPRAGCFVRRIASP